MYNVHYIECVLIFFSNVTARSYVRPGEPLNYGEYISYDKNNMFDQEWLSKQKWWRHETSRDELLEARDLFAIIAHVCFERFVQFGQFDIQPWPLVSK